MRLWKRQIEMAGRRSLYLSMMTPEIVMGIALLAFYQWVFRFLAHPQLGMHTVILAHVAFCISYVVITVTGAAAHHGPRRLRKPRSTSAPQSGRRSATGHAAGCLLPGIGCRRAARLHEFRSTTT